MAEHLSIVWTITSDHHAERFPDDLKHFAVSLAGTVGPEGCPFTSEEIATHPDAQHFRLSDEFGVLQEGLLLGDLGDLLDVIPGDAEPWRGITAGWGRTVEILQNGVWHKAMYEGMFFDDWSPFGL